MIGAFALIVGCNVDPPIAPNLPPPPKPAGAPHSRLRVHNVGSLAIRELVIMFPYEDVRFGDVGNGTTTKYLTFPEGSIHWRRLATGGKVASCRGGAVTDWLGERPLPVGDFTYELRAEPYGDGSIMHLLGILRDIRPRARQTEPRRPVSLFCGPHPLPCSEHWTIWRDLIPAPDDPLCFSTRPGCSIDRGTRSPFR